MSSVTNFTQGKLYIPFIKFALPLMLAMFLQVMYGAVDLMMVGLFATPADISGVATGSQVLMVLQAILMGFSISVTILLGQSIGANKLEKIGNIIGSGICVFSTIGISCTLLFTFFAQDISVLVNAPEEAFLHTVDYIFICGLGVLFITSYNLLGAIFRGLGDSKTPLMTVFFACIANIILDFILIAYFDLGAKGAAIATIMAQAISVILSLLVIKKRTFPFVFGLKNIAFHKEESFSIIKYGLPLAFSEALVNLSFLAITGIVNTLGLIASAGLGVSGRLIGFIMLLPGSLAQAVSTVTAQNYGARSMQRAVRVLLYSYTTGFSISLITAYFTFFHGDFLLQAFTNNTDVIQAGYAYLRAYSIDVLLTSFLFSSFGFFSGCGKTTLTMFVGIFGAFAVRIPFSYYMSIQENPSLFMIGLSTPLASALQLIICFSFLYLYTKEFKRNGLIATTKIQ